jgi:antitoxin ParD1/3/4
MAMVKKSIAISEQQDIWLKEQLQSGNYGNESEIFRDLIRERQSQNKLSEKEIEFVRAALIEAENSDFEEISLKEIWARARSENAA